MGAQLSAHAQNQKTCEHVPKSTTTIVSTDWISHEVIEILAI